MAETAENRVIWRVTGRDAVPFLQGLVTNDVAPLQKAPGMIWTALLSPQGKYLADFFVVRRSSDPAGTGANLSGAQNRLASDLIRNAQSAFV